MTERCAIVTGGGRNIGQAISLRLKADGYRVFALDRVAPEADALREDAVQVDLMDVAATKAAVGVIAAKYEITCLVNNVGLVAPAPFDDVDLEDLDRLMHLNLRTSIVCAQALVPRVPVSSYSGYSSLCGKK